MSSSKPVLTWLQILGAIKAKTENDIQQKVVPAVNTGRFTLGKVLVHLGNKIQPKR